MNREARLFCEEYFSKLNEVIEVEVGSVYMEGDVQQDGSSSTKSVLNPPGSREKNQRNKRLKSTSEKKCNQAKARKKKKMSAHNSQATNLDMRKSTEVIPKNVAGVQESSKLTNLEIQRSTKVVPHNADAVLVQVDKKNSFSTLIQNGVPLCMNGPYGGSSSQDDVVPTLNLLSNSNPNDRSLRQVSSYRVQLLQEDIVRHFILIQKPQNV
ncbi:hypothetical protein Cgig2_028467 [Carnegiea gigantea]|uniref:Uncharacterized protein n=1 Tax=Carnegiea gigantea TaxID=171969 RepID=A0A9Q1QEX8_9CARY|nr:hypothetical protein Cgig2_028467 [Carnegiea gigantea]